MSFKAGEGRSYDKWLKQHVPENIKLHLMMLHLTMLHFYTPATLFSRGNLSRNSTFTASTSVSVGIWQEGFTNIYIYKFLKSLLYVGLPNQ